MQQRLAVRSCHLQRVVMRADSAVVRAIPTATTSEVDLTQFEVERVKRHWPGLLVFGQISRGDTHHHPRGTIHIVTLCIALVRPAISRWFCRKSISRRPNRRLADTHCYPQNVRGVGFERNRPTFPLQHSGPLWAIAIPHMGRARQQAAHGTRDHIPYPCCHEHDCRAPGSKDIIAL